MFAHEDPGLFLTFARLPAEHGRREAQDGARRGDRQAGDEPRSTPRELQKAKNQLAAQAVYQRERVSGLATQIGVDWVVAHDPLRPFTSAAKYDAVTAADVQRVAKKYLAKTNLSMLTLVPAKPRGRQARRWQMSRHGRRCSWR